MAATPAYGWVITDGNTRRDQLAAGRAYVRMNLAATRAGLGFHPNSQSLQEYPEMADKRREVHELLGVRAPDGACKCWSGSATARRRRQRHAGRSQLIWWPPDVRQHRVPCDDRDRDHPPARQHAVRAGPARQPHDAAICRAEPFRAPRRRAQPGRTGARHAGDQGDDVEHSGASGSQGLPDQHPDPNDGRGRRIAISAAGRKARERAIKSVAHHIADLEREIGVRALEGALPLLTKLRTYLDQRRGET